MIEMLCECDGLPSHSHVYKAEKQEGNRLVMVLDPYDVRIWVDWRAVARSYAGLALIGPIGPNNFMEKNNVG